MNVKNRLQFSVDIRASRERIWHALTAQESFRDWCTAFHPGSYFEGDWSEGSEMRFLGPMPDGTVNGMVTRVVEHRPGEFIRCEHFGVIERGNLVLEGPEFDEWIPASESYTVTGGPDVFTLSVETEVPDSHLEHFTQQWPEALQRVKKLAEA